MSMKKFRLLALVIVLMFSFVAVFGCSPAAEEPEEPED